MRSDLEKEHRAHATETVTVTRKVLFPTPVIREHARDIGQITPSAILHKDDASSSIVYVSAHGSSTVHAMSATTLSSPVVTAPADIKRAQYGKRDPVTTVTDTAGYIPGTNVPVGWGGIVFSGFFRCSMGGWVREPTYSSGHLLFSDSVRAGLSKVCL